MRDTHVAWRGSLLIWNGVLLLSWFCAGCSMVLTEASKPEVRYVLTPMSPADTYARAQRAALKMGAEMMREDTATRTFVAKYKGAIALHVHVNSVEEGTQMTVTGSVLPQKVGYGVLHEVDDFVVAYRREH
jgi:hypothetical protein